MLCFILTFHFIRLKPFESLSQISLEHSQDVGTKDEGTNENTIEIRRATNMSSSEREREEK